MTLLNLWRVIGINQDRFDPLKSGFMTHDLTILVFFSYTNMDIFIRLAMKGIVTWRNGEASRGWWKPGTVGSSENHP